MTILLGAVMVHVYSMTYADRPAVRPKISGPCCPNIDDIPHKTLQDKEAEVLIFEQWSKGELSPFFGGEAVSRRRHATLQFAMSVSPSLHPSEIIL